MDLTSSIKGNVSDEIKVYLKDPFKIIPSLKTSIELSKKYGLALHPAYLFYWNEFSVSEIIPFLEHLKKIEGIIEKGQIKQISFPISEFKSIFEILGIEHEIDKVSLDKIKSESEANIIVLDKLNSEMLFANLGYFEFDNLKSFQDFKIQLDKVLEVGKENLFIPLTEMLSKASIIEIRDKGGSYIGARMGRPEKAKMRKQFNDETRSHGLFPVGDQGGKLKNIVEVLKNTGFVESEFRIFYCENCNKNTIYSLCENCSKVTKQKFFDRYTSQELSLENDKSVRYKKIKLEIDTINIELRKILGSKIELPKHVKGISQTINKHHTTEHISKSILRAVNGVYVNKDGTVRYDMIEMGLTHFKPKEIGTSIEKLKELGYLSDYLGNPLKDENQILEIFPQDVILPDCTLSGDELASDYVVNTAKYVDDLLEKLYKQERFYNFKTKEDTIGHLIIGLAPHTSAGIIGRIIGYSKTQGCFSHPVWHAAQRRNLDGDENGIMLLLDGLINFSREYLPDRRGSRTMDVSLVLTSHLYLDQIDDEVHGMDIVPYYSLELYKAAKEYKSPKEVKIEKLGKRIDKVEIDQRYRGYSFTHNTDDMNNTVLCSSYKSVPTMEEKLDLQLGIGNKLRAVDANKVGTYIIDKHFMKDIKGNLRKFSMQNFRCTQCNEIYRRPPLVGKCTKCGNHSINFTISEGSIKKYLEPSFKIIREYDVDPYIVETLQLANLRIEGVFGKEEETQKSLKDFFG